MFNCKAENIKVWNNLTSNNINPGQVLRIFERVAIVKRPHKQKPRKLVELSAIDLSRALSVTEKNTTIRSINKIDVKSKRGSSNSNGDGSEDDYMYYSVRRGESVKDIADKFPGVSIEDILNDNNITSPSQVKSGRVLMIRQL